MHGNEPIHPDAGLGFLGLRTRDYIAIQVLNGVLANNGVPHSDLENWEQRLEKTALLAYRVADALLKVREGGVI